MNEDVVQFSRKTLGQEILTLFFASIFSASNTLIPHLPHPSPSGALAPSMFLKPHKLTIPFIFIALKILKTTLFHTTYWGNGAVESPAQEINVGE